MKEYKYDDIKIGQEETFSKRITSKEMQKFAEITGDKNPLHTDEEYASKTQFGKRVVYGLLPNSYLSTLAGMYLPGKYSLILTVKTNFRNPCYEGEEVTIIGRVTQKVDAARVITLKTEIKNSKGVTLQEGEMQIKVLK